jgi:hypothetical protein
MIGSPQFVPPGRCIVLLTKNADALWVTSWPFGEYVRHAWPGLWVNTMFRNESQVLSSVLIREAIAATRTIWEEPNDMITFIDRDKVKKKRDFGRCYLRAGFEKAGETKGGLLALKMSFDSMPEARPPQSLQSNLIFV